MKYLQFSSDNALNLVSNMVPPLKDTPPASVMFPTSLHLYVATLSADITHSELCYLYWQLTGRDPLRDFPKALGMQEEYPNDRGTFEGLIAAIETEATHTHHHAEKNEYPNKAALIRFAREQWERNKKCSPAMKPSEGTPFYIFLEDLVEYVDREWSIASLLRAEQAAFLL